MLLYFLGDGMVSIFELAMYGDLHTFLCAKNKMMVTQANEYWSKLDSIDGSVQMCAYVTPTPPKLNFNIPELLDIYVTSEPFTGLLSQPLSELDFTVFAHQIAMGLQHLSSHKVSQYYFLNLLYNKLFIHFMFSN